MPLHIEESVDIYIKECKANKQQAAGNDVVSSHLLLVVYLAGKYYRNSSLSFSDLIQIGNLGLLKAVDSYDPTRSDYFRAHASFVVRREMWNYAKSHRRKHEYQLSLEYLMREDEEEEVTLAQTLESHDSFEEGILTQQTLKKFLAYLSPQEQQVLCLHYGLNKEHREYTYAEMEHIFHMKQRTIKTMIDRSIRKLRVIARSSRKTHP